MTGDSVDPLSSLELAVEDFGGSVATASGAKPPRALDARRLVSELTRDWEQANHRRLPREGATDEDEDDSDRTTLPLMTPTEVLEKWKRDGAPWIKTCSRLHLRAVVAAARDMFVGPALLTDGTLWMPLKNRLRDRQADQVLNAGFFVAGAPRWTELAIRHRARVAPDQVPGWWVNPGPEAGPLASEVALGASTRAFVEVLEQMGLPDTLPDSFLVTVVRASQATHAADIASLCSFLDRGMEMGNRAVIFDSTREWVRRATQVGIRFPGERLAIAELLRGRIGDLAIGRDDARWLGLEDERRIVRTWLVGEVFRVLFSHLVPEGDHRHQTEPRRRFWSKYDESVEKIWLLVCDDHRARLDGDEALAKLKVHGLLEVLRFTGQSEQDALWMQLRSSRGESVTILEGNANMPIRVQAGAVPPPLPPRPSAAVVEYQHARALFPEFDEPRPITHRGDWQSRASNVLADLSIYARGER
jgi:hypothetical protein